MASASSTSVSVVTPQNTTNVIYNVNVLVANTEVSQALPSNVKGYLIRCRDKTTDLKLAFSVGQSGTTYFTIRGSSSYEEIFYHSSLTLYFQISTPGVVEIIAYS